MNNQRNVTENRSAVALFFIIAVVSIFLRFYGLKFGEPHLYHPDEIKLVAQAGRLLETRFLDRETYFGIGVYPPFYTYLFAFVLAGYIFISLLTGRFESLDHVQRLYSCDPFQFFLLGRVLTALLGVLSVWVLFKIVRMLYSRRVAWFSAAFFAVDFTHVRHSHFFTVDAPATFFVLCAFYFISRSLFGQKPRDYLFAAVFSALAVATKFSTFFIGLPFLYAHFTARRKNGTSPGVGYFNKNFWLYLVVGLLVLLLACPLFVLDFGETIGGLIGTHNFEKVGKLGTGGGLLSYWTGDQSPGFGVFYPNSIPAADGIVLTLLAALGLLVQILRHRKADVLLILFPIFTYLFFERMSYKAIRHILPVLPFLAVARAVAMDFLTEKISNTIKIKHKIAAFLVVLLVGFAATRDVASLSELSKTDPRTDAVAWMNDHLPELSRLCTESFPPEIGNVSDKDSCEEIVSQKKKKFHLFPLQLTTREDSLFMKLEQYIIKNRIEYYIADSFTRDIFAWKYTRVKYPNVVQDREKFFQWLESHSIRLITFPSTSGKQHPSISIYKLNAESYDASN